MINNNYNRGKRAQVAIDDFQDLLMLNEEEIEEILKPFPKKDIIIKPKGEFYTTSKKEEYIDEGDE